MTPIPFQNHIYFPYFPTSSSSPNFMHMQFLNIYSPVIDKILYSEFSLNISNEYKPFNSLQCQRDKMYQRLFDFE